MRLDPMTLLIDDYLKLRSLVTSQVTTAFADPKVLRELYRELCRATLLEPGEPTDDIVAMNSIITLRDLQSQALETYTLVFPLHADIANRQLSVLSPAGASVLGCRQGENLCWPAHSGWRMMMIEEVISATPAEADARFVHPEKT